MQCPSAGTWGLAAAFVLCGAVPLQAAVAPENRPALEKEFHHPDLFVREHQEKVAELSSTLQSAVASDLRGSASSPTSASTTRAWDASPPSC